MRFGDVFKVPYGDGDYSPGTIRYWRVVSGGE